MLMAALYALRKLEAGCGVECELCLLSFPKLGKILGIHADVGGAVVCGKCGG